MDRCVPIRLGDLYEGMELGQCLDIIKTVKDDSIAAGIEVMKNQGHSGMSWGLYDGTTKIDDINTDTVGYKDYTLKAVFPKGRYGETESSKLLTVSSTFRHIVYDLVANPTPNPTRSWVFYSR